MVGCFTWILNKSLYLGQVWIYIYTFSWTYFFPILLATSRFIFISFVFVDFMEILRFFLDFFAKKDWALPKPGLCLGGPVLSVRSFSTWKPPFFSAFFQWASWMQRKKQLQTLEPPRAEPSQEPRQPKLWSRDPWKFPAVFVGSGAWRMEETFMKTHRFIMMFCLLQLRKNMWKGLKF